MCLNTVATAIVTGLWLHAEQLLVILGQDRVLSQMGARYLLLMLPALWLTAMFEGLKRYLAAQGIGSPVTIATMTALACSPP